MSRNLCLFALTLAILAASSPVGADDGGVPSGPQTLRIAEHGDRAVKVDRWDPRSPQRLVRIDGSLYQEGAGVYFPVVPERISVGLAEGIDSWEKLVSLAISSDAKAFEALARLRPIRTNRLSVVDLVAPKGTDLVDWCEMVHLTGLARFAEVATHGEFLATQNDPRYVEQWALNNTGQTGGTPGADVDAERAWDLTAGDPSIVVAILDSGVDVDHEDLAANVWHNDNEIPDNGIDDDSNGYIDDWEGWNFDLDTNDPRPSFYHGTFVAGIVNAVGSNGIGIAGLAGGLGGPGVRGMALGVGQQAPNSGVLDDAILYAADNGAHVITISLSVGPSQAIDDALAYAYNVKDVFIDCASGNNGPSVSYPATRPEAMAVGSTTHNDGSSAFSNPGPEVEVSAPGSSVLSTNPNDGYGLSDGTSFAAPYVGALAALIRSRNPGLPASSVRQLIIDTAEDINTPGFDERTGWGRINAYEAVSGAASSDATVTLDASAYPCDAWVGVTVSDIDIAGAGSISIAIRSDTESGGESATLNEIGVSSGVFRGSIATETGSAVADGVLQVAHGDTIVAEYVDADDGMGGSGVVKTRTAAVDCEPPLITGVGSHNITSNSATIAWTTDEPANSTIRYGEVPPPSQGLHSGAFVTYRAGDLQGLAECTTYHYEVESADPQGNTTTDDNGGAYFTFETYGVFPDIGTARCHRGQVLLDRTGTYGCDDSVGITVVDSDLDTDPGVVETVDVLATSTSEPAGEWVTLTETTAQSSRFQGSIPLASSPAVTGDGSLSVSAGDLITVTYRDADDGNGLSRIATATSTADCTPPMITDVRITEITSTRVVVEWNTDEPATSTVDFGPTPALGSTVQDNSLVTAHRLVVSAFDACDRAYFRVSGADEHGEVQIADAGGQPFAVNMNQIGGLVYHDNFETDTGWLLEGDWERGTPQGLGSPNADPTSAWSGVGVLGNDLSGAGAYPGDYEPTTTGSAISPVFSAKGIRNLQLIVHRKLGVTSADEASIQVITRNTDQVWTSQYQANDEDWIERRYSIGAFADNQNAVQIEFRLDSSDPDTSFGWNIDELIVKDSTQPDYLVCGGCAGAPTFRGATNVYDPDPCGPGGLIVVWEAAPAWGTGTSGSYDVYRGLTPDFVPDATNRVATGLTGATWTDTSAPVDTPVWYVVRSRNDESCAGGEGLADDNLVRLEGLETTSQSLPQPVGNTMFGERVGEAHVRLEWMPSAGAHHYVVHRGQAADFSDAVEIGSTVELFFEDPNAAIDSNSYRYKVFAVDACGRQE
jgi:subtilisin family serine protease